MHGIKGLVSTFPNGIIGNVWDPVSIRENDTGVLNFSQFDEYIQSIQPETLCRYEDNEEGVELHTALVDSVFPQKWTLEKCIPVPIGGILTNREHVYNTAHASLRQMAELPFGGTVTLSKITQSNFNWHLLTKGE